MLYLISLNIALYSGRPLISCLSSLFNVINPHRTCVFGFIGDVFDIFCVITCMRTSPLRPGSLPRTMIGIFCPWWGEVQLLTHANASQRQWLLSFPPLQVSFLFFFFFLFRREGLINDWRLFHVESHRAHYKNKSQWSLGPFALFIQQNRLSETNKFFGKKKKVLLMDNIHGHVEKSADNHENSHFRALIAKSIKIKRNPVRLARAS